VHIHEGYPVTVNNPELTAQMLPTLAKAAGKNNLVEMNKITGAEDFSFYALEIPSVFVFLGGTPSSQDLKTVPSNHSPYFYADESSFKVGTKALSQLAVDYLDSKK
jgi:amidohydrolase